MNDRPHQYQTFYLLLGVFNFGGIFLMLEYLPPIYFYAHQIQMFQTYTCVELV